MSFRRTVPLALALLAGLLGIAPSAFPFGQNKIAYDRFDWKVLTTTHFEIHHYAAEPELLARVASMSESAYERMSRKLNFQIGKKIPLIVYATHADFEQTNVELSFIPEGVGAFAEPARNRIVLPADLPDERLQKLIAHELTHIFEYEILFQGELRKALLNRPPTWFMEGLASWLANDEDDRSRMVLRDAVLAGLLPGVASSDIGGYFAYRFGHAAFDFVQAEYGADGVRDFIFEFRSALGNTVEKALKRAFDVEPEEFDIRFRRWLQKQHVQALVSHGEPVDFGERIRGEEKGIDETIGAVPSPSGELAAAFAVVDGRVDVVLMGLRDRKVFRNLTAGRDHGTEYPIVQFVTTGPQTARDLAWSPDGNTLAYFARRERDRALVLLNALDGSLLRKLAIPPDQPLSPTFTPAGDAIVFRGMEKGRSDIFRIDLATGAIRNLTDDPAYDLSPIVSPDGKWLYHVAVDGTRKKIFRMSLADPSIRERVTDGEGEDEDPSFSPDGKRLFFASTRGAGISNIYSLDLETGELLQWTDVTSGAFLPSVVSAGPDGFQRLVYTAYFRRSFDAWVGKMKEPLKVLVTGTPGAAVTRPGRAEPEKWQPDVEVPIDPKNIKAYGRGKMFLENADIAVGITNDQRFFSSALISWADLLGNRRAAVVFDSLSSYTNWQAFYWDIEKRLQKGITGFNRETFYYSVEEQGGGLTLERQRMVRESGIAGTALYPVNRYLRLEGSLGWLWRKTDVPLVAYSNAGDQFIVYEPRSDNYPEAQLSIVGDTADYREFGPWSGTRFQLDGALGVDTAGTTIRRSVSFDLRHYVPVTTRSLFAFRLYGARSDGEVPDVFYFGGLDTLRGYDFRTKIGTRIAYLNTEFRFPLVDQIRLPFGSFRDIRGRVFFDVGGAWLENQTFRFWDASKPKLVDGLSAYGWGFSWNLGGIELHWDFAHRWNIEESIGGTETTFWIGQKF
jgi:hypothetical protein